MTTDLTGDDLRREFDEAAPRYDLMVTLNPGYHRQLRRAARELIRRVGTDRARLLDLGCGSGASTRAMVDEGGNRIETLLGVDASAGMLARAEAKQWPAGTTFHQSRAEDLESIIDQPLDGILAAYLFRNVAGHDRDATLAATFELLAPGGSLVVQEYSVGRRPVPVAIWTAVCWLVVIPLSIVTTRRTRLYRYLWRSVLDFDSVDVFTQRVRKAGFADVRVDPAAGWQRGILHTFSATKPAGR